MFFMQTTMSSLKTSEGHISQEQVTWHLTVYKILCAEVPPNTYSKICWDFCPKSQFNHLWDFEYVISLFYFGISTKYSHAVRKWLVYSMVYCVNPATVWMSWTARPSYGIMEWPRMFRQWSDTITTWDWIWCDVVQPSSGVQHSSSKIYVSILQLTIHLLGSSTYREVIPDSDKAATLVHSPWLRGWPETHIRSLLAKRKPMGMFQPEVHLAPLWQLRTPLSLWRSSVPRLATATANTQLPKTEKVKSGNDIHL